MYYVVRALHSRVEFFASAQQLVPGDEFVKTTRISTIYCIYRFS